MATVYKRTWKIGTRETRTGWICSYIDAEGIRRRPHHKSKGAADAERVRIEGELADGTHVPDRESKTVLDAARGFLADYQGLVDSGKRERSTLRMYEQHANLHLKPFPIARVRLSRLHGGHCRKYGRALETSRTDDMAARAFGTFRMILDFAIGENWLKANPAKSVKIRTAGDRPDVPDGGDDDLEGIPTPDELRALWTAALGYDATGRAAAFVAGLIFGGLTVSELRGLPLANLPDATANRPVIKVRQRADRWNVIGRVKAKKRRRDVPVGAEAHAAFKRWRLAAPKAAPDGAAPLAFPNSLGKPWSYPNLYRRLWCPIMLKAGLAVAVERKNSRGKTVKIIVPKFALHVCRHAAISAWIANGATPKQVMAWAGHSSIQTTYDIYGHLWADPDGEARIVGAAEKRLLG